MHDYIVIATWGFGQTAVKAAAQQLEKGAAALDAALAGAHAVEDDPKVHSVGFGGLANAVGTVSLDACVMEGDKLSCGAVAGLENVRHPSAVARRVMEKTPHVLLVGEGARWFALEQGFRLETLLTPESVATWEKERPKKPAPPPGERRHQPEKLSAADGDAPFSHDTVTVLVRDAKGSLAGVCTTSGLAHKLPGRVGDSPLIGHGLYVDNEAGAAGGTGVGEEIIRIGGSLMIVEAMRTGKTAQEACELAIDKINRVAVRRGVHPARVAFVAVDAGGSPGAASTAKTNFQYAVARPGKIELLTARELEPKMK